MSYLEVRSACEGGCVGTAANARSLSSLVADLVLLRGLLLNERFEKKKEASREGLCCACAPGTGVLGADPRRHAFSYDVSVDNNKTKLEQILKPEGIHGSELITGYIAEGKPTLSSGCYRADIDD